MLCSLCLLKWDFILSDVDLQIISHSHPHLFSFLFRCFRDAIFLGLRHSAEQRCGPAGVVRELKLTLTQIL